MSNQIVYLELPATATEPMKTFYGTLFGWSFQDWGSDYAAFSNSGLDGGFNASSDHPPRSPLAVIATDDIASMETRVQQAGGTITVPTFTFPGGRRFHFTDPGGNELAVMQTD